MTTLHQLCFSVAVLLFLNGCANTPQPSYYLLAPTAPEPALASRADALALGIGPIDFPQYLDRPQIVTENSANQIELAQYHRWGESLQENFTDVLATNLSIALSTDRISIYPWNPSTSVDYKIAVDVTRFISVADTHADLVARWRIYGKDRKKPLLIRQSRISIPLQNPGYAALAAAKSTAVGQLSADISTQIQALAERGIR